MELRLDRQLAEKRLFPAINVEASEHPQGGAADADRGARARLAAAAGAPRARAGRRARAAHRQDPGRPSPTSSSCGRSRRPRPRKLGTEKGPSERKSERETDHGGERGIDEAGHPPRLRGRDRALFVREHVHDPEHQVRAARGDLLELPPVLHGQAEAGRHGRAGRAVPAPLREAAGRAGGGGPGTSGAPRRPPPPLPSSPPKRSRSSQSRADPARMADEATQTDPLLRRSGRRRRRHDARPRRLGGRRPQTAGRRPHRVARHRLGGQAPPDPRRSRSSAG